MKDKELDCPNCGPITVVAIEGDRIAGRIFAEMYFECTMKNGKCIEVKVTPTAQDYFDDFNKDKWLAEMKDFANTDADHVLCAKCLGHVNNILMPGASW